MKGLSAENQRDLILTVGTHKQERPLSPIEVAKLLDTAIKSGTKVEEISGEILLDSTMMHRFLRLLKLSTEISYLVGWGGKSRISFSTASEIARLITSEEQEIVARATLEHELSKREVIQIIENRSKFSKPINECIEEILKMRPRIVRRYLFIGAIKSPELQNKLRKMSQKERDILFDNVVTLNIPDLTSWDGSLGTTRFTLIGNEDLDKALSNLPSDFSASINGYLESSIK